MASTTRRINTSLQPTASKPPPAETASMQTHYRAPKPPPAKTASMQTHYRAPKPSPDKMASMQTHYYAPKPSPAKTASIQTHYRAPKPSPDKTASMQTHYYAPKPSPAKTASIQTHYRATKPSPDKTASMQTHYYAPKPSPAKTASIQTHYRAPKPSPDKTASMQTHYYAPKPSPAKMASIQTHYRAPKPSLAETASTRTYYHALKPSPAKTVSMQTHSLVPKLTSVKTASMQLQPRVSTPAPATTARAFPGQQATASSEAQETLSASTGQRFRRNHSSARTYSDAVDRYVNKEVELGATQGPYQLPPFENHFVTSPLQTVPKGSEGARRVVVDLSFPPGSSVNDGISSTQYLGDPLHLTLPSHEAFESLIRQKGPGCLLFKRDLSRAYRQIPVDPHDYHLLGFTWQDNFYYDTSFPFGLRSAAMACQRTTNAVAYIHASQGYKCVNYIDDFGGAETPENAQRAFDALGTTFDELGLAESADKATRELLKELV
ncbi:cytoplasmic pattern recognition receptor signaling pathway in response to virus [Branchiostoma belcheri]|nr:cytoplasmic pattern recognition receptor signaling pathway in response to virus [Branchiostoma belcheri]